MNILALETSCDETAAAVVQDGRKILSSVVASQIDQHSLYGGVVPEIASRLHCEAICGVTEKALKNASVSLSEIDAVAVTYAPGLIGALLVGINYAKSLAYALQKPCIPVHHLRAHIAANYLETPDLQPPFLAFVISGGHTHLVEVKSYTQFHIIGRTLDDAAGEAFDKVARVLGFTYPGGEKIDKLSLQGDPTKFSLPFPKTNSAYDFSFSGLKTAVLNIVHQKNQKNEPLDAKDMAASFQNAACEILTSKLMKAAKDYHCEKIVLAGGVSANSELRRRLQALCKKHLYALYMPPPSLCGDNAAMVGSQAYYEFQNHNTASLNLNGTASLSIEEAYKRI